MRAKQLIVLMLLCGGSTLLGGCQYSTALMKAGSALTMSPEMEDEMGRTVAIAATNRWPIYENPELNEYVTLVGLTLASASARPDGNWVFGVLNTPEIGAYSGPNGYIMVTRGAIATMQDESELAGVLAHEMGHVINRDGLEAVKKARLTEAALEAASTADRRVAEFNERSNMLVEKVLTSGWSQPQETKADSDAIGLLREAGYDPSGLPRFLARMQQRGGAGGAKPVGTHPGAGGRIARTDWESGGGRGGGANGERVA